MKLFFLCALGSLAFSSPVIEQVASAEMWWCSACGLAYPTSQKFCLNKDCPLFRKPK